MKRIPLIFCFVLCFGWVATYSEEERLTDSEFEFLLNYGLGNHENLLKIAQSGHPRALTVLRELNARDPRGTWEDLTEQYGYPIPTYRGPITVNQKALETALAAAGDKEAFDKIANEFLGIGVEEERKDGLRADALIQLIKMDTDWAVAIVGSQLDDDSFNIGYETKSRLSLSCVWALSHMKAVKNPPTESYYWQNKTSMDNHRALEVWRKWWKENKDDYPLPEGYEFLKEEEPVVIQAIDKVTVEEPDIESEGKVGKMTKRQHPR